MIKIKNDEEYWRRGKSNTMIELAPFKKDEKMLEFLESIYKHIEEDYHINKENGLCWDDSNVYENLDYWIDQYCKDTKDLEKIYKIVSSYKDPLLTLMDIQYYNGSIPHIDDLVINDTERYIRLRKLVIFQTFKEILDDYLIYHELEGEW